MKYSIILTCLIILNSCSVRVNYSFDIENSSYWKKNVDSSFGTRYYDQHFSSRISPLLSELMTSRIPNGIYVDFEDYGYEKNIFADKGDNYFKYRHINKFDTSLTIYDKFYIIDVHLSLPQSLALDTINIANKKITRIYVNNSSEPMNFSTKKSYNTSELLEVQRRTGEILFQQSNYSITFSDTIYCSLRKIETMRIEFDSLNINQQIYKPETLYLKKTLHPKKVVDFLVDKLPENR